MAEQLYVKYIRHGDMIEEVFAYGEDWVSMALYMDDIGYKTEAEAREAWEKWKEKNESKQMEMDTSV